MKNKIVENLLVIVSFLMYALFIYLGMLTIQVHGMMSAIVQFLICCTIPTYILISLYKQKDNKDDF